MKLKTSYWIVFLLLWAALLVEQFTKLDFLVQNQFFDFANQTWLLEEKRNFLLHFFLYSGAKAFLIMLCVFAVGVFAMSFKWAHLKKWRYACILFLLVMAAVPLALAGAKSFTHMYCPAQLEAYGGLRSYFSIFTPYPDWYRVDLLGKGRCFPAGHASGGFALMVLFFCFKRRSARVWGLVAGLAAGWAMGGYQMLRGEHFLSHTVVTMLGAWLIILGCYWLMNRVRRRWPLVFPE